MLTRLEYVSAWVSLLLRLKKYLRQGGNANVNSPLC